MADFGVATKRPAGSVGEEKGAIDELDWMLSCRVPSASLFGRVGNYTNNKLSSQICFVGGVGGLM